MANRILRGLRAVFVENWSLKLLAVLLSALTFYTIRGATSFEVPYTIPVVVKVGPGIAILEQSVRTLDVTFRGSQEALRRLDQKQIKAVVRPRATDPGGSETVPVGPRDIEGAAEVRVVSIRPPQIALSYDREATKQASVLPPKIIGTPLMGRVELRYQPQTASIRGPRRRLERIVSLSTEPVDVDGRVESFSKQVRILAPSDTWITQIEPSEVTVDVSVITELTTRNFTNVTVMAVTRPGDTLDVYVKPPAVAVMLHGRNEVLANMLPDAIQVFVNCTGLDAGATYELPVRVHLPLASDVTAAVDPGVVEVTLREK